jgi:hypothetical protein
MGSFNDDLDRHITGNYGEDRFKDRTCEHCGHKFDDEDCLRCPKCKTPYYCDVCDDEREFDDEEKCKICNNKALEE